MKNTLFYGNGLNLLNEDTITWKELLGKIAPTGNYLEKLPYTFLYEYIILKKKITESIPFSDGNDYKFITADNKVLHTTESNEELVKKMIADKMSAFKDNEIYKQISRMNFDHYITTNYDNVLHNVFTEEGLSNYNIINKETLYSIRRKRIYTNNMKTLWQIHGEVDKHKSIMLGLDHYCGSIGKIDSYIKGHYKVDSETIISMSDKLKNSTSKASIDSWIDLFFYSNIFILGFSLDFSETDLWWILTKRKRFLQSDDTTSPKNDIYICDIDLSLETKYLLDRLAVKIIELPNGLKSSENYKSKYLYFLNEIEKLI